MQRSKIQGQTCRARARRPALPSRAAYPLVSQVHCHKMVFGMKALAMRIRSFVSAAAVAMCMIIATLSPMQGTEMTSQKKLKGMLTAISKIRSARDIKLDCSEFVYPHLGQSDRIKYYIDLFSDVGIHQVTLRRGKNYVFGFEIHPSYLKKYPNLRFGRRDDIAVVFYSNSDDLDALIHSCSAVLRAAPNFLRF